MEKMDNPESNIDTSEQKTLSQQDITEDKKVSESKDVDNSPDKLKEIDDTEKIKCINERYEGKNHPDTDIPYEKKQVEVDGEKVEGVFPQFKSDYDAQLSPEQYHDSDYLQNKECNSQLKSDIEKDPELRSKFDDEQLDQIKNGETPDGYTWHHNEEPGKMQLVDSDTHDSTRHTGGQYVWGGGSENR